MLEAGRVTEGPFKMEKILEIFATYFVKKHDWNSKLFSSSKRYGSLQK